MSRDKTQITGNGTFGLGMDKVPERPNPLAASLRKQAEEIAALKAQLEAAKAELEASRKKNAKLTDALRNTENEITRHVAENNKLAARVNVLEEVATTDPLTGLLNRRGFQQHTAVLAEKIARDNNGLKKRSDKENIEHKPLKTGLIAFDIDYFKSVNDTYGHAEGDKVLKEFAIRLSKSVRPDDVVGRLGGEEFFIAFKTDHADKAQATAERIRRFIEDQPFDITTKKGDLKIAVTSSLGLTILPESFDGSSSALEHWLNVSDEALYRAKGEGCQSDNPADFRNRVCFAQEDSDGNVIIHECPRTGTPRVAMPQKKPEDQQTKATSTPPKKPKKLKRIIGDAHAP